MLYVLESVYVTTMHIHSVWECVSKFIQVIKNQHISKSIILISLKSSGVYLLLVLAPQMDPKIIRHGPIDVLVAPYRVEK